MPYVGRENITGEFIKLDAIPQAASNTFNLQRSGAAFAPGTTEQCIVSVNGVTQAPQDAFDSAVTGLDEIDGTLTSSWVIQKPNDTFLNADVVGTITAAEVSQSIA